MLLSRLKYTLLFVLFSLISNNFRAQPAFHKTYGFSAHEDQAGQVIETDCGLLFSSHTSAFTGTDNDVVLVSTNNDGVVSWAKSYGLPGKDERNPRVVKLKAGGYAVTCNDFAGSYSGTNESIVIFKTDKNGNLSWSKYFCASAFIEVTSITELSSGDIVISGKYDNTGLGYDMLLISISSSGALNWAFAYGNSDNDEVLEKVFENTAGELILVASKDSMGIGRRDALIYSLNSNGTTFNWGRKIGTNAEEVAKGIVQTPTGGYAITGQVDVGTRRDVFVMELNNSTPPNVMWAKSIGVFANDERGFDIGQKSTDGDFLVFSTLDDGTTINLGALSISDGVAGGNLNYFNLYSQSSLSNINEGSAYMKYVVTADGGFAALTNYENNSNKNLSDIQLFRGNAANGDPGCNNTPYNGTTVTNMMTSGSFKCINSFESIIGITKIYADANITATSRTINEVTNCITPSQALAATAASTDASCGNNDGTATATPSGGTSAYTFSWSNGQTANPATGLAAGSYSVVVTDAAGCTFNVTATVNGSATFSLTQTQTPPSCTNNDGTASVTPSVSGSYTYTWSGAASAQASNSVTGLPAGTYTVSVNDGGNCSKTASFTLTNPNAPAVTISSYKDVICNGSKNGTATALITGGQTNYTYSWVGTNQTTLTATGLDKGTYTFTVSDANNCTSTGTVIISEPLAISANTFGTVANCQQNNATASVNVSGGNSPYTYSWNNNQTNKQASGLSAGTYTVLVKDKDNCSTSQTITIVNPNNPQFALTSSLITCGGGFGTAQVNISGGGTNYTYSWSNGQTTLSATGLIAGNYTATVTDVYNCSASSTITLSENQPIQATINYQGSTCGQADGSANVTVTGGISQYNYSWSNNKTTSNISNLAVGFYTVTITDNVGCTKTATVYIDNSGGNLPTVTTNITSTLSCWNSNNGSAQANTSGGNKPYSYSWSNNQTDSIATGLTSGTYVVIVTDANQCVKSASVTFTAPTPISSTTTPTNVTCNNYSDGKATVVASGGTSPYNYSWFAPGGNTQTGTTASNLIAGTYTVITTDKNQCTNSATVIISAPNLITPSVLTIATTCYLTTDGKATVSGSGGATPYTYSWSNNQTTSSVSNLSAGNYTVTVSDKNACTISKTVTINPGAGPNGSVSADTTVLEGQSVQLNASGGNTYNWIPNTFLSCDTCASPKVESPSHTQQYVVTITDQFGCTDQDTVTVFIINDCNEPNVFLPSAFSPNNDGINDVFMARGDLNCINEFSLTVFNRWGEKVFETIDPKIGWDGTYNSNKMNSAVFIYYIKFKSSSTIEIKRKGNITLIR